MLAALCALVFVFVLASCAPGANAGRGVADSSGDVAGFWLGFWHGVIAPVTFFISLFKDGVNVYEIHNSGNWYNFGFVLGAGILLSGGAAGARKRR